MNFRSVCLVSHASFAIAVLASSQLATAAEGVRYVDRNYGFSFSTPRFTPSDEKHVSTVPITLSGSPDGSFAPNVNVVVQNLGTTLEAYQQQQLEELTSVGWELVGQSRTQIGGAPALRTHARGSLQGLSVEFLAVAMLGGEGKMYVLTCTSTTKQFSGHQAEFERVVASFLLHP